MLCFLTTGEGVLLGCVIVLLMAVLNLWAKKDKLALQAKGLLPQDEHPQDRFRRKREKAEATEQPAPAVIENDPLDWLKSKESPQAPQGEPEPFFMDKTPDDLKPISKPQTQNSAHWKAGLFALSMIIVWFAFATWYDNLSRYVPPTGDDLGDFRILYLKKFVGAILPLISAVGAALGLLFMINPRYYIYLNGWYKTDYDFYADLCNLGDTSAYRRVLVFALLFGLLLVVALYVLLHSSPQELTL